MTLFVVSCDGARVPRKARQAPWQELEIRHRGLDADLNFKIENLTHALRGRVPPKAADLVRIAAYAYATDQSVRRGGQTDFEETEWARQLALCVPVSDPDFWSSEATRLRLVEAL